MSALATSLQEALNAFADAAFGRLAADFSTLLPAPVRLLESGVVDAGWENLVQHFAPLSIRIHMPGPSLGEEQFTLHLDQRATYLLPGTMLMMPDPVLADLVRQGVFNDDLQKALADISANLVGSLKRSLEALELGQDLVQGETVWEPELLAQVDADAVHLRGLLGYRQTKLMLLLTVPPCLLAALEAKAD